MAKNKLSRPRPHLGMPIERELWAKAAGRCEFRGCNKLLYVDSTTQSKSNLGKISHIVAFSPEGPRGHPGDSIRLERDISNLMLTCADHGKIIDDKDKEQDYPTALLREFKREHEQRIRTLTDIREDAKTHVLIVQTCVGGKPIMISERQVFKAVLPLYPANEHGFLIDLNDIEAEENEEDYWGVVKRVLGDRVKSELKVGGRGRRPKHLSLFAIGPVPLLIFLGAQLGDINTVVLHQRHRTSQSWEWSADDEPLEIYYDVIEHDNNQEAKEVAVLLSISDCVQMDAVNLILAGDRAAFYEIRANEPGVDFLRSAKRLEQFGLEYRKLIRRIRERHGGGCKVHLFAAVPSPVAIMCGQSLQPKVDPEIYTYEFNKTTGFTFALSVNGTNT